MSVLHAKDHMNNYSTVSHMGTIRKIETIGVDRSGQTEIYLEYGHDASMSYLLRLTVPAKLQADVNLMSDLKSDMGVAESFQCEMIDDPAYDKNHDSDKQTTPQKAAKILMFTTYSHNARHLIEFILPPAQVTAMCDALFNPDRKAASDQLTKMLTPKVEEKKGFKAWVARLLQ